MVRNSFDDNTDQLVPKLMETFQATVKFASLVNLNSAVVFLKKINHCIDFTLEDYWNVLADYFCITDSSSIDLFWFKYDRWNENRRYQNMIRKLDEEFYFSDWVNSVNNLSSYSENQENLIKKK